MCLNTRSSVVSSAAVLRIISREIAELPVVATRKIYRGKVSADQIAVLIRGLTIKNGHKLLLYVIFPFLFKVRL